MNFDNFWKKLKYWQKGLVLGVTLDFCILIFKILVWSRNFEGWCVNEESGVGWVECSFTEYFFDSFFLSNTYYWWLFIIIVLGAMLMGYVVDKYRHK